MGQLLTQYCTQYCDPCCAIHFADEGQWAFSPPFHEAHAGSSHPDRGSGRPQGGQTRFHRNANIGYNPVDAEDEVLQQVLHLSQLESAGLGIQQPHEGPSHEGPPPLLHEDAHIAAAIQASLWESVHPHASHTSEIQEGSDPDMEAAIQASLAHDLSAEEARERNRLRAEQAREYEESLLVDQQREAERISKQMQEEENRQLLAKAAEEKARVAEAEKERVADEISQAQARLVPPPPEGTPGRVELLLRVPDGRRLRRAFLTSDTISQVYDYVVAECGKALVERQYRLVTVHPRCVYEDRESTLEGAGLHGQCLLLIEYMD